MKRILMIALPAVALVLVATMLVVRGGGGSDEPNGKHNEQSAPRRASSNTSSTTSAPATTATTAMTAARAVVSAEPHFVCPEGGLDAVVELQRAWEDGHQPWLGSAEVVAAACTWGAPESLVEPVAPNRYQVTHTTATTSETAVVELAQPLGPHTVWVATQITYTSSGAPHAQCSSTAILPVVANELESAAAGEVDIVSVDVQQCRNGYARVLAIPDNSACGLSDGRCLDNEQVFLADHDGRWAYLTSGTGIACEYDDDLFPELLAACQAIGLR